MEGYYHIENRRVQRRRLVCAWDIDRRWLHIRFPTSNGLLILAQLRLTVLGRFVIQALQRQPELLLQFTSITPYVSEGLASYLTIDY